MLASFGKLGKSAGSWNLVSWISASRPNILKKEKCQKGKRKVQGVPQSQTAALLRHQEEKKTDKTKQVQIDQTYKKHKK